MNRKSNFLAAVFGCLIFTCFETQSFAQSQCVCLIEYLWDDPDDDSKCVYVADVYDFTNDCNDGSIEQFLVSVPPEAAAAAPQTCNGCGLNCKKNGGGCLTLAEYLRETNSQTERNRSLKLTAGVNAKYLRTRASTKSIVAKELIVLVEGRYFRLQEFRGDAEEALVTARAGYEISEHSGPFQDIDSKHIRKSVKHLPGTAIEITYIHIGADSYPVCELRTGKQ